MTEVVIESSIGSIGDSYDNALAETINVFFFQKKNTPMELAGILLIVAVILILLLLR